MNLRAHARTQKATTGTSPSPGPEILGALALPLAALAGGGVASLLGGISALLVVPAAWFLLLLVLYSWVGSNQPVVPALGTVVIGSVLLLVEFLLALGLAGNLGGYLILAIVASVVVLAVEYHALLGRR